MSAACCLSATLSFFLGEGSRGIDFPLEPGEEGGPSCSGGLFRIVPAEHGVRTDSASLGTTTINVCA